jgi:hypothetical protein
MDRDNIWGGVDWIDLVQNMPLPTHSCNCMLVSQKEGMEEVKGMREQGGRGISNVS